MRLAAFFKRLARNSSGTTMMEYGLIVAVVALVIIASLQWVASSTSSHWDAVSTDLENAT